jgi:hypothetical protein
MNSRTGNVGAVWGGDSTIFSYWGTSQMQVEPMNVTFTFKNGFDSLLVIPLDSMGKALGNQRQFISKTTNRLRASVDQTQTKSLWYVFKFIKYDPTSVNGSIDNTGDFTLHPISPNVIQDELRIECDAPTTGTLKISMVDMTGKQTTLWEGNAYQQTIIEKYPVDTFANGLYTIVAQSTQGIQTQKVLIIR